MRQKLQPVPKVLSNSLARSILVRSVGAVTPLGADWEESWQALMAGTMALQLGASNLPAALQDFPVGMALLEEACAREELSPRERKRLDAVTQLAWCASQEALRKWRPQVPAHRFGVVVGVGYGATSTHLQTMERLQQGRSNRLTPFTIPASMPNATASQLSMLSGAQGPALTLGTACASGLDAMGLAFQLLQSGSLDCVLCGGAEWITDAMGVGGMAAAKALSKAQDSPHVLKPFDATRQGTAVGSGAAMFLLQAIEQASAEGVVVLGYGCSSDAHHITAPLPDGSGAEAAMRGALSSANLDAEKVDVVFAHGTGTPLNDAMEAKAIARLFPHGPTVTSTKGQYGHAMGASGALHSAFAVRSIQTGLVPPTRPCSQPDPSLPFVPLLPNSPQPSPPQVVMVNAFGFGGHNSSLLFAPATLLNPDAQP